MAEGKDKEAAEVEKPEPEQKANGIDTAFLLNLKLRKQVRNGDGEMVDELKFREPTGGDIERIGYPVNIDWGQIPPLTTINSPVMGAMMSHLAAIPPSSIKSMHPKDWASAAWRLAGFFTPEG